MCGPRNGFWSMYSGAASSGIFPSGVLKVALYGTLLRVQHVPTSMFATPSNRPTLERYIVVYRWSIQEQAVETHIYRSRRQITRLEKTWKEHGSKRRSFASVYNDVIVQVSRCITGLFSTRLRLEDVGRAY